MPNQTRRKQRGGIFNNTRRLLANKAKQAFGLTTASNIRKRKIFEETAKTRRLQSIAPSKVANLGISKKNVNEGTLGTFRYTKKLEFQAELDKKIQQIEQDFQEGKFDAQAKEVFNQETIGQIKLFLEDFEKAIEKAEQSQSAQVILTIGTPVAKGILRALQIFIGLCILLLAIFIMVVSVGSFGSGILDFAYSLLLVAGAKKNSNK